MSGGHDHSHDPERSNPRRLALTLVLVLGYMAAEIIGGLASNSLALLADAGHMFSDAAALGVALVAMRIARRPVSATHTFGYRRAEILAALANGAVLMGIVAFVTYRAVARLGAPPHVEGGLMLAVATGGLVINLAALAILHGGKDESLNVRGAWLHVVADTLGSVGAMASGALVALLGWNWADPVASLLIAALVLYSAWMLVKQAIGVLMQAVPEGIDVVDLERSLTAVPGVVDAHDLHVWAITPGRLVLSAHLGVEDSADRPAVLAEVQRRAKDEFGVRHSTVQLDCPTDCGPCSPTNAR